MAENVYGNPVWSNSQSNAWRGQTASNSGSGYYNPNSYYGGYNNYWNAQGPTPFWGNIRHYQMNDNPDSVYQAYQSGFAGGTDPFSTWVRNQYGQTYDAYKAATLNSPDLTYQQILSDFGEQGMKDRYMHQAPEQRGIRPGQQGAGRVQWLSY